MASPGVIGSSLKHYCWNPRKTDFFPSFEAEIELDHGRNVIRPFKPISGKLKISTTTVIKFHGGIRVQLDANVKLRFQSKVDNRLSTHWAVESIFTDASDPDEGNYISSPFMVQILGDEEDSDQRGIMDPGTYSYPFTLPPVGSLQPLPAPFRSQYGSLQFYVAAYMGSAYCYVQVAEKLVGFGGFLDISQEPKANDALSISSHLLNSIFSSKPFVTFTLTAEKTGYHPGEEIPFILYIDNPKGKGIKSVKVEFVRKCVYSAQGTAKTTSVTLDSFNADLGGSGGGDKSPKTPTSAKFTTDTECMYMGTLTVPKPCIPTYSGKPIYGVTYFLSYEVSVQNHPGIGKGKAEVIIGTTKPSAVLLVNKLQSRRDSSPLTDADITHEEKGRPRSNSVFIRRKSSGATIRPVLRHGHPDLTASTVSPLRAISMLSISECGDD